MFKDLIIQQQNNPQTTKTNQNKETKNKKEKRKKLDS